MPPLAQVGGVPGVVVLVVLVVVVIVVVVVDAGQLGPLPGDGQASQQLVQLPTVPSFAVQWAASFLVLHLVTGAPFLVFVRQQVTKPGFPQVDLAAHLCTAPAQLLLASTAFACCAAQLT
jgi:hypothetical protein